MRQESLTPIAFSLPTGQFDWEAVQRTVSQQPQLTAAQSDFCIVGRGDLISLVTADVLSSPETGDGDLGPQLIFPHNKKFALFSKQGNHSNLT